MTYNQKLFLVSGIVAGISLVVGIVFFWVGPSTAPGRPLVSLMCFTVTLCFGLLAYFCYLGEKMRAGRLNGVEVR